LDVEVCNEDEANEATSAGADVQVVGIAPKSHGIGGKFLNTNTGYFIASAVTNQGVAPVYMGLGLIALDGVIFLSCLGLSYVLYSPNIP
jgi:hypothetical protein